MLCCRRPKNVIVNQNEVEIRSSGDDNRPEPEPVSEFRTFLPQVLACSAKNLILLDLGMTLAFPTLVIASLLKSKTDLSFSEEQASWFSSIAFICQPAGSVVSGLLFEPLGRKKAMLLVNVPHIIAWIIIYRATSAVELYAAGIIMGLGVGFMEAPIITYVGEISQPRWRGVLTSYAGIFVTLGLLFVYFLGTIYDWRMVAAICTSVPVLAILVISLVPESPIWLLSKGRLPEAERSLCWLRGWVQPELVKNEFQELMQHNYKPGRMGNADTPGTDGPINTSLMENKKKQPRQLQKVLAVLRLDELCRRQTLQPLLMILVFFFFCHAAGITSTRPYMVRIFEEFGSPIDSHLTTVISSLVGIVGNISCMLCVGKTGKKWLSLASMITCTLLNLCLSIYGAVAKDSTSLSWLPIVFYLALNFAWSAGIGQVPWMLTSEVFPFRGRGVASGVAAASSYLFGFAVTKTYLNLHHWMGLSGVFGFYGALCVLGCFFLYYLIPETEGKSLEEVETIMEDKFLAVRQKLSCSSQPVRAQTSVI